MGGNYQRAALENQATEREAELQMTRGAKDAEAAVVGEEWGRDYLTLPYLTLHYITLPNLTLHHLTLHLYITLTLYIIFLPYIFNLA